MVAFTCLAVAYLLAAAWQVCVCGNGRRLLEQIAPLGEETTDGFIQK